MLLLMIGDIIAQVGCDFVRERLPRLKYELNVDVVIANGENSAIGNGITPYSANFLFDSGVDIITTGNHVFKRFEINGYFSKCPALIRPANYHYTAPGSGYYIYDGGSYQLCVINMMGTSYMEPLDCPFATVDAILNKVETKLVFVDFHAEATGEKKAFGYYLDGRVSAVIGTHTHVQTADEQLLPHGTAFITDVGMTGPIQSVLGVEPENIIQRLRTHLPIKFNVPETACHMEAVMIEICNKTGQTKNIKRLKIE